MKFKAAAPPLYRGLLRGLCATYGWPAPEFERPVRPPRRWRFDACWPTHGLALEVQGGLFLARSGHSGGKAQVDDMEKLNAAQLLGWMVLQVTPGQISDGTATLLLSAAFRTPPRAVRAE